MENVEEVKMSTQEFVEFLERESGDENWHSKGIGDSILYFSSKGKWIITVKYLGARRERFKFLVPSKSYSL